MSPAYLFRPLSLASALTAEAAATEKSTATTHTKKAGTSPSHQARERSCINE
jgi:hypothetical protein